jgi:tRNA threonylcarbamoyladenosine biosynthesis protein TsaB
MLILGIETSGLRGSIAVCSEGECLGEIELENAPRRHAQTLVTQIGALFRQRGLKFTELAAVAVSIGPGSFTGLRVGTVCAKTLAYATGCRLVSVDTFAAIAANSPPEAESVHVVADAQRGDLFAGEYRRTQGSDWLCVTPPRIVRAADLFASLTVDDRVSGPGLQNGAPGGPGVCKCLPAEAWIPAARQVAEIGRRQLDAGLAADVATLEPLYLRRSAAEEKADPVGRSAEHADDRERH